MRQDKIIINNGTESQEVSTRTQIERLNTINRSMSDFTKFTPSSNGLSFGGVSGSYNNLTVDEANFNKAFGLSGTLGGQANSQAISIDDIEQIQVNVSPYDVRQESFSGAGINSVTGGGTNKFEEWIYNFFRSENTQGYKVNAANAVKHLQITTSLEHQLVDQLSKIKYSFSGVMNKKKSNCRGQQPGELQKPEKHLME